MGESFVAGFIISSIQNFLYDISIDACKGIIQKIRKRNFLRKLNREISEFFLQKESRYLDSDTFRNFLIYHKPLDRIMKNTVSIGDTIDFQQLINNIIDEAKDNAKSEGTLMSVGDKSALRDLCILVNETITRYFEKVLNEAQRYIVSNNIQNTRILQKEIKNLEQGSSNQASSIEKLIKETSSLSSYKAEPIADMICSKMWRGQFEEVENICQLVASRSEDLELSIAILKSEMFENKHDSSSRIMSVKNIQDTIIRDSIIRNIIPLMYFRKEKFLELEKYVDSEPLRTIMSALENEDYSYLFSEDIEICQGIETHKYSLNQNLIKSEEWLVKQLFAIYIYHMKQVNSASVIEDTIDASQSWFSALILYDKKVDMFAYRGINNTTKNFLERLKRKLELQCPIYNNLSFDLKAIFYALIIKLNLMCGNSEQSELLSLIPQEIQAYRPVKDFILAARIETGKVSFTEVYEFCETTDDYMLLINYIICLRNDEKTLIDLVQDHSDLLNKSGTIFFIYAEALAHLNRISDAKTVLENYKKKYGNFFEYWNIYLNVEQSENLKEEFLALCQENKIRYTSGNSGCILVERLLTFKRYDLAEIYNKQLEVQQINLSLSKKYKAFILYGKNKAIDALQLFKEVFEEFPNDLSVLNAIISISINIKRKVEEKYIKVAEQTDNVDTLGLAGAAYITKGNFTEARRCIMRAMFLIDDYQNPAFNQYLGLKLQDEYCEVQNSTCVEKNTAVLLQKKDGIERIQYCIHGDSELPQSPYEWHGDIQLYIGDAARLGIYRKRIGDEISINGVTYKIMRIVPLDTYISRICFDSIIKSNQAFTISAVDGKLDVDAFTAQISEVIPDSKDKVDWIKQYNNFNDIAFSFYMLKGFYNTSYTQFVEFMLVESKSCIREMINNNNSVNDKYILSFSSLIILKQIGISNTFLISNNIFVPESTVIQINEDTSEIISHYARDEVSSMGIYDGKPYVIKADNATKDKWLKEAGELRSYVEKIPSVVCKKDWNVPIFEKLNMTEILGIPDYDAISIGMNDEYTVIGTESMLVGLAINEEIGVDIISITNWLLNTSINIYDLISYVGKLVEVGCVYAITERLVEYISNLIAQLNEEDINRLLSVWDSLLGKFDTLDETYKKYGIDALRNVYVIVYNKLDNPVDNPVMRVLLYHLLLLFRIKINAKISSNGDLELSYYQEE